MKHDRMIEEFKMKIVGVESSLQSAAWELERTKQEIERLKARREEFKDAIRKLEAE